MLSADVAGLGLTGGRPLKGQIVLPGGAPTVQRQAAHVDPGLHILLLAGAGPHLVDDGAQHALVAVEYCQIDYSFDDEIHRPQKFGISRYEGT